MIFILLKILILHCTQNVFQILIYLYFLNKLVCSTIKQLEYIKFEDKLNKDFLIISNNETILQPIYISNNKLFN